MKCLLAATACFGFSMQPAPGQVTPARISPAPTVIPAPVHHPVRRKPVQPAGTTRIYRSNNGVAPHAVRAPVVAARPPVMSYADAFQRHHRERHDRAWWRNHYTTIVFVGGGYYYWDVGYWFPAWGYDPLYDSYDYDGPIYTYGNLLPDQVILNVQRALLQLGYYAGNLTGSLGPATRAALSAYQQDAGLTVTGAIDAPTVEALGLY